MFSFYRIVEALDQIQEDKWNTLDKATFAMGGFGVGAGLATLVHSCRSQCKELPEIERKKCFRKCLLKFGSAPKKG